MDDGCRGFITNQPQVRVLKMNVVGNLLHYMSFVVGRGFHSSARFIAVPGLWQCWVYRSARFIEVSGL